MWWASWRSCRNRAASPSWRWRRWGYSGGGEGAAGRFQVICIAGYSSPGRPPRVGLGKFAEGLIFLIALTVAFITLMSAREGTRSPFAHFDFISFGQKN